MIKKVIHGSVLLCGLLTGPLLLADYEEGLNAAFAGDYETAFREFSQAAENGLDLAQYNLAILYFTGRGVDQDLEQAFHWTRQAALQGHSDAQANLGSLYLEGDGVDRDVDKGVDWFARAGKAGHADAAYALARMYFDGSPVDRNLVQAHAWANQALYNEHPQAADLATQVERRLNDRELSQARRLFARWQIE